MGDLEFVSVLQCHAWMGFADSLAVTRATVVVVDYGFGMADGSCCLPASCCLELSHVLVNRSSSWAVSSDCDRPHMVP